MKSSSVIVILVFVVLALLAVLLARQFKPLSPAQRWALAASGNLGATWNDRFDRLRLQASPEEARQMLLDWWNIHSADEAAQKLVWLAAEGHSKAFRAYHRELSRLPAGKLESWLAAQPEDDQERLRWLYHNLGAFQNGDLVGWDMERLINLARVIHTAGWMDEATAWNHIEIAARRLQSSYGSWREMSDNYLAGRIWWGGDQEANEHFQQSANRMLTERSSPWVNLDWRTPLM